MSGKSYSNGGALNIVTYSACDAQTRTFSNEKTMKLWVKLHDEKCDICRNLSKKTSHVYKSDIQCMKGETTKAYLDNFHKNCEYI